MSLKNLQPLFMKNEDCSKKRRPNSRHIRMTTVTSAPCRSTTPCFRCADRRAKLTWPATSWTSRRRGQSLRSQSRSWTNSRTFRGPSHRDRPGRSEQSHRFPYSDDQSPENRLRCTGRNITSVGEDLFLSEARYVRFYSVVFMFK